MSILTGQDLVQSYDMIDATQNLDNYASVSGIVKNCAVNLSKMSNDLRLMSSGPRTGLGEINLPVRQNGSSIMPGKINPVIPEVVNQVAFNIIGNDVTMVRILWKLSGKREGSAKRFVRTAGRGLIDFPMERGYTETTTLENAIQDGRSVG